MQVNPAQRVLCSHSATVLHDGAGLNPLTSWGFVLAHRLPRLRPAGRVHTAGQWRDAVAEADAVIRGRTFLVVDHEPDMAHVLAGMLSADGHEVDVVENGLRALERVAEREYDVVISHLTMPGLDGPGLYGELQRERPDLLHRLVFVSGDVSPYSAAFLRRTGARVIEKPYDARRVRAVVQEVLRSR